MKIMMSMVSGLVLLLAAAGPVSAAMTPDAKVKSWPANPARHEVLVKREGGDDAEKKMIAVAERAMADAEKLRKAIGDDAELKDKSQWWYGERLGIRVPFAITADAVDYYTKLVEDFGKQTFKRYIEPSSRLEYKASVKAHDEFKHGEKSFKDVHVVTLKLNFSQQFAATGTEGMSFEKERTVVLDAGGKVLLIIGDGKTEAMVLAI
jgi:hypothetical protein